MVTRLPTIRAAVDRARQLVKADQERSHHGGRPRSTVTDGHIREVAARVRADRPAFGKKAVFYRVVAREIGPDPTSKREVSVSRIRKVLSGRSALPRRRPWKAVLARQPWLDGTHDRELFITLDQWRRAGILPAHTLADSPWTGWSYGEGFFGSILLMAEEAAKRRLATGSPPA